MFRRFFVIGLAVTLVSCTASPPAPLQTHAEVSPTTPNVIVPAAQPGEGVGLSNYGLELNDIGYSDLTAGNTLFRPLADGGTTRIYISPAGQIIVKIISPNGAVSKDVGKQTVSRNEACWLLSHTTKSICFKPYWNDRLLTLVAASSNIAPAQFLIEKGNPAELR